MAMSIPKMYPRYLMLTVIDSTAVIMSETAIVLSIVRETKVTMRWRWVSLPQSSRKRKAPSRSCRVTRGMSSMQ